MIRPVFAAFAALLFIALPATAQDAETGTEQAPAMTLDRLEEIILRLDPDAQRQGPTIQFTV